MVDEKNADQETEEQVTPETADPEIVAAANMDFANRLPHDQIKPEPDKRETQGWGTPYGQSVYGEQAGDDGRSRVHVDDSHTTLGGGTQTPMDAELAADRMNRDGPSDQEQRESGPEGGNTEGNQGDSQKRTGFGALNDAERQ